MNQILTCFHDYDLQEMIIFLMENLLSTTISTISSTGPIPPFPPLTGRHFNPNSAEAVDHSFVQLFVLTINNI